MRFGVLGPLAVWDADGRPVAIAERKVRALLAVLLAHAGRVRSVDGLVDDLWGDQPPRHPANALQGKVAQLRRALEHAEPGARRLVVTRAPGYLLDLDPDLVDSGRFTALTARARAAADPRARAALWAEALDLWRGPAFADFADEPFARAPVVRFEEERLLAEEEHAEARLALGEHHPLVGGLTDLVARHPARERLRALHMRALHRSGRTREALDSYAELRRHLADELGLDPGGELVALHQAILRDDPALAPTPPTPLTSPTSSRGNVPTPVTALIGRDEAVARVRALVENNRLVTLTGPGGVGKTRLAIAVAAELADTLPDGAWLVELAALDRVAPDHTAPDRTAADPAAALVEATMAALDIRQDSTPDTASPDTASSNTVSSNTASPNTASSNTASPADRLAAALAHRRLLLVLDNCEHLVEPVAELAAALLRAVPGLRVLTTSREPLGLGGELPVPVPPLALPDPLADADPATALAASAVHLFTTRAGITLDADNASAVAAVCRRLDGIPLALELAASRVRTLGVHGLLARLDDRFAVLASAHRDTPTRQRTLRAVIDWSWELLTTAERVVLRRLAVHAEGCAPDAAEVVCSGDGVLPHEVPDLVACLVDRSLVVLVDRADGPRYQLLESIRDYCLDRLREAGELSLMRQRHASHYTELAERVAPLLRGPEQRQWLARLDVETPNLRRALEHGPSPAHALRLVNALGWYWIMRGRLAEARRALESAIAAAVDSADADADRTRALTWHTGIELLLGEGAGDAGHLRAVLSRYDERGDRAGRATAAWLFAWSQLGLNLAVSEELTNRALADFTALDDQWGVAAALSIRARHALARGDLAALRRDGERADQLFGQLGDRWGRLQSVFPLASLAEITGDHARAAERYRAGLATAEELGLWPDVVKLLCGLGRLALLSGDHTLAHDHHQHALRVATEHAYHAGKVEAELGLGLIDRRRGLLDSAETHLRRMLDWFHRVDFGPAITLVLAELGFVAEHRGDADRARALHHESLARAGELGDPRAVALALEGLAGAHALAGRHRAAAVLLGAATATRDSVAAPLPPAERGDVDRITATSRKALGDKEFVTAFQHGTRLSPQEAVAQSTP
ncbi:AfsR/SARP family transcriptional regulator [Streptoalloteichus hindustanus]|uniref:AfsR/SARP family transcriptional regulator n=1 Tax=Streptoalloteichus hindustanus TaxID=2017 RepID=UPI0009365647|nr:BTAD domain-containing putative transcriptional regulator [Streptoalloteichus hindustanus]